ncbi:MAG: hypothetical protein PHT54_04415 [Candidatus Nanoarchaeia archaeon]|nr:hypothetical protein [Candidatus Nanoarchaeia archaeon]
MADALDPEPWYKAERDGSLEDYLKTRSTYVSLLFKGYDIFERLKELGVLKSGSGVRVMDSLWLDQCYIVTEDFKLEGLPGTFAGKPGRHNPKDILKENGAPWEFLE